VHSPGSNQYTVRFSRGLTGCVPGATLSAAAGEITASPSSNTVVVRTFSPTGAPVPASFNLIVAC
jgi:hypothetical protein